MHWLALLPPEADRTAWELRALRFTPRVAWVDEALLLEVSGSLRLWGGPERLARRLFKSKLPSASVYRRFSATSLVALALLRLRAEGRDAVPLEALPLATLSAAAPHLATLARMGCTTWGQLRALPRAGVARRFGAPLLAALDAAYGERPEAYPWLTLPEVFDHKLELPSLATSAPELLQAAQYLLGLLQDWLRARQRGVLALELEWTLDLKRLNGVLLAPTEQLVVRTAQPTQGMAHLRRLVAEQLGRAALSAPANALRLRSLETAVWAGSSASVLIQNPADHHAQAERLHELIERLSARLGPDQVLVPRLQADHRPERMQRWVSAQDAKNAQNASPQRPAKGPSAGADTLYPTWLLIPPQPLLVRGEAPQFHGPLHRLTRTQRVEAGWWDALERKQTAALRDYYIARSPQAGLVWIFCERPASDHTALRWFLQGGYG